jgi:hypothetical protein
MKRIVLKSQIMTAALSFLFAMVPRVAGQNATDGTTPPAIAPGTPPGSYALSNLETIDYYNGKLNFVIPLHPAEAAENQDIRSLFRFSEIGWLTT